MPRFPPKPALADFGTIFKCAKSETSDFAGHDSLWFDVSALYGFSAPWVST
jgi:hypothetical protein